MKLLFILDHVLMHYRVPLFQKLTDKGFDVTVVHSGNRFNNVNFKQIISEEKQILKFKYKKIKTEGKFDVVIQMQNLHYLNVWFNTLNPFRKYKLIDWGIGSSTVNGLNPKISNSDKLRNFLSSLTDHIILYSEFPIHKYSLSNREKITIAHNTILNPNLEDLSSADKDSFLFIGSLTKRKGLDEVLYTFKKYLENNPLSKIKYLQIVGSGEEFQNLKELSKELNILNNVYFHGQINDFNIKRNIFLRSIINISPNQAGLSVLESFSFGIPFITKKNAISGGEHLNVRHLETGLLYKEKEELFELMQFVENNINKIQTLGSNAFKHYSNNRNFDLYVDSFIQAINKVK